MIITETITIRNKEFVRNYSSDGFYIERDNIKYSEAIDLPEMGYTYTETNELIEKTEDEEILKQKAQAYDIITGVAE